MMIWPCQIDCCRPTVQGNLHPLTYAIDDMNQVVKGGVWTDSDLCSDMVEAEGLTAPVL
jgi:hypothetical protein